MVCVICVKLPYLRDMRDFPVAADVRNIDGIHEWKLIEIGEDGRSVWSEPIHPLL
jgi:hypothetical protein